MIAHVADNGFPSEHMLFASTIAMLMLYVNKRVGIFLWIIALCIGAARVAAGVHHTLDVAGAILIAVVAVIVSQYVITLVRSRRR